MDINYGIKCSLKFCQDLQFDQRLCFLYDNFNRKEESLNVTKIVTHKNNYVFHRKFTSLSVSASARLSTVLQKSTFDMFCSLSLSRSIYLFFSFERLQQLLLFAHESRRRRRRLTSLCPWPTFEIFVTHKNPNCQHFERIVCICDFESC